ncbi:MAG: hypothetical protein WA734_00715 [Candidatus Acidiferrales bacterium]
MTQICGTATWIRASVLAILSALTLLQLSGCTVGPRCHTPTAETPTAYKEVGDWKPAQPNVAAERYLALANTRYTGGVTSCLEVTTAESAALADEVTAVNILGRRMVDAVSLVQALGGGWDRSALPERPECCGKLTSQVR